MHGSCSVQRALRAALFARRPASSDGRSWFFFASCGSVFLSAQGKGVNIHQSSAKLPSGAADAEAAAGSSMAELGAHPGRPAHGHY